MRSQSRESLVSMPVKSAAGQEMGGEESTNAPSEKEKAEGGSFLERPENEQEGR